jgi:dTDP-glucose 4,6-dehydratase
MKNKVFVIGSNSFSGSNAVRSFISEGYEVFGVSRSEEPSDIFLPYKWDPVSAAKFKFSSIDLNLNIGRLKELLDDFKPNIIVNFAAQGMVAESWLKPLDWFQTNVMAQIDLVEFLKTRSYLERFIQFTTPEVYGSTSGWISESTPFNPSTPYATSRATFDFHLKNLHDAFGFPVIFTRAANVYGPGQQIYRIIPRAMLSCIVDERFPLHGSGTSERAFIHMDDVSDALCKIISKGTVGDTYHISTDQSLTIMQLVEVIGKYYGKQVSEFADIVDDRQGKDKEYKLSSKKLNDQLNWSARIALSEGLVNVDNWLQKNLNTIKSVERVYRHKK